LAVPAQPLASIRSWQIVGTSRLADCETQHAVLWKTGRIHDLNDLIPPGSGLELFETHSINDAGVIAGNGLPPGCDDVHVCGHAYLLFPCDEDRPAECKNEFLGQQLNILPAVRKLAAPQGSESRATIRNRVRNRLWRLHLPGLAN